MDKNTTKGVIISGPQGSGKTTIALDIPKAAQSVKYISQIDCTAENLEILNDQHDFIIVDEIRTVADLLALTKSSNSHKMILVTTLKRKDFETKDLLAKWEVIELQNK